MNGVRVLTVCSFLTINTTDQTLINDIPTLVDFILKHNLFVFDDKQYLVIALSFVFLKNA